MEIHAPEGPTHSLKDFLIHIVIVTIGILIEAAKVQEVNQGLDVVLRQLSKPGAPPKDLTARVLLLNPSFYFFARRRGKLL